MTKTNRFLLPTLTILGLNSDFMSSKKVRKQLDLLMKKNKNDKIPFRGTQTRFDKGFYNFIVSRETSFVVNDRALIEYMASNSGDMFLKITKDGEKFLRNHLFQ